MELVGLYLSKHNLGSVYEIHSQYKKKKKTYDVKELLSACCGNVTNRNGLLFWSFGLNLDPYLNPVLLSPQKEYIHTYIHTYIHSSHSRL